MRTDVAIAKLCEVAPILDKFSQSIRTDEELMPMIKHYVSNGYDRNEMFKILPIMLNKYSDNMYDIIAVMCDKTAEEVKSQSLGTTIKDIKSLIEDEEMRDFFTQYLPQSENKAESVE